MKIETLDLEKGMIGYDMIGYERASSWSCEEKLLLGVEATLFAFVAADRSADLAIDAIVSSVFIFLPFYLFNFSLRDLTKSLLSFLSVD